MMSSTEEIAMAVQLDRPRRLFTVDEYQRMAEAGILRPDERIELIEGEIFEMSPIDPRHAGCVINLNRLLVTHVGDRAVVSPQNPLVIRPRSEPQPDLVVLRRRSVSYSRAHPVPEDVLLAIEVANTSVRFDRAVKSRLYARAGIGEYWLVDVAASIVMVHRRPSGDRYAEVLEVGLHERISPAAFPDVTLTVADFFA